ncbi:MAG: SBBP repeat-containing protein [Bacteroidetes bacterium]|nr:SBBP repeat-containing protein [Bacteroidota bacterium]
MKRAILLSVIFCSAVTMVVSQPSFVWAGRMGGTASSSAPSDVWRGIALDKGGNVYTIGNFWGNADMNPGPGTFYLNSAGVSDVFLSKLDSAGDFVWAKKFGGTNYNDGNDIAIDDSGYIYITGSFLSATDFDPGSGVVMLTPLGYRDVFVCKLDADGNLIWAKQFGGEAIVTDQVDGTGIAVDAQGNVYTTGAIWYGKADFDPGPAVYNLSTAGDFDIFICKLNRNGDFEWAHRMGGTKRDLGSKIAVDRNGYAYLTGYFTGTVDFDPGVAVRNLSTSQFYKDIFICRFDSTGALSWANQIGVLNGDDVGQDIAVDASGNVYTTGNFYYGGADFDPGIDTFNLNSQSSTDVFICKWDSSANFLWARDIGGPSMVIKGFSIGVAICIHRRL